MNINSRKKAVAFLVKTLIASLFIMTVATGLFYWKGLIMLDREDLELGAYYDLI